jgi:hypothetical protein
MSKEYSREAFEEAQRQVDQESESGAGYHGSEFLGVHSAESDVISDYLAWRRSGQAKLEAMLKEGHREAKKLNEKYNQLRRKADQAESELRNFCERELGTNASEADTQK